MRLQIELAHSINHCTSMHTNSTSLTTEAKSNSIKRTVWHACRISTKESSLYIRVVHIKTFFSKIILIVLTEFTRVENLCQTWKFWDSSSGSVFSQKWWLFWSNFTNKNKFNTSHGEMGYVFIFYSIRVSVESHYSEKTINFALCAVLGVLEDRELENFSFFSWFKL